jgi:type II secretory pathway pseudopilin PulG
MPAKLMSDINKSKNKSGMSLIETMAAILIFMFGMIAVALFFSRTWKNNAYILEAGDATASASSALDKTVKSLRKVRQGDDGSYPVVSVGNFDLVVYLDDNNDGKTERVHYFLSNGTFKKGVTAPTAGSPVTYPAGDQTVTTVLKNVVNTNSQPVFTYYNDNYPIDTVNNPLVNPQVSDVSLIQIHLWVNIKPNTAPDNVNFESFAELRNLNAY